MRCPAHARDESVAELMMRGSGVYRHLWGTDEVSVLFEDSGRLTEWLRILAALAEAQADLELIPRSAAREIAENATLERIDIDYVVPETKATAHSTLGLIRAVQQVLDPQAGEWYCYGATVQDVSDTWTALVMARLIAIVERDLTAVENFLLNLAEDHRDTGIAGRTHGQVGLPITFGFKAAVWAAEVRRHLERLAETRPRVAVGQLGGAAGTGSFWASAAPALLERFCRRLELDVPELPWVSARDRIAGFGAVAGLVTHTLAKIGNEVLQLARPQIGELAEPFTPGQVGSITMPHKRNPERAEHLVTLARLVRSSVGVLMESTITEHERDGRAWKAEWAAFPDVCLGVAASCALTRGLLDGLVVDPAAMAANLERDGYAFSERVMRALADRIGKQSAHLLVYDAAMSGREAGLGFKDALLRTPAIAAHLDEAAIDRLLDPRTPNPAAGAYIDRVLARRRP